MPALAATAPITTSINVKLDAHGTRNNPAASTASAGAMSQRVVSGLNQGENTIACITNMTTLHSVNISAIWYGVRPSSCLPRSASPTSNTPTPAETMKVRMSSFGTCLLYTSDAADDLLCVDL